MAKITYLNEDLYEKVKKEADKKFEKDSYVKNMWILKEYEKRGGKTNKEGKKPSDKQVKKSVKGYEINLDLWEFEVAEDKDYSNYCEEFGLETEKILANCISIFLEKDFELVRSKLFPKSLVLGYALLTNPSILPNFFIMDWIAISIELSSFISK